MKVKSSILLTIILFKLNSLSSMNEEDLRWNAFLYQNNVEGPSQILEDYIDKITSQFKGDEFILDIGCGPGSKTYALAQKAPKGLVYGIDGSSDMIEAANTKYSGENIKFLKMSAETFEFEENFNLITSFGCLHWLENRANSS